MPRATSFAIRVKCLTDAVTLHRVSETGTVMIHAVIGEERVDIRDTEGHLPFPTITIVKNWIVVHFPFAMCLSIALHSSYADRMGNGKKSLSGHNTTAFDGNFPKVDTDYLHILLKLQK